MYTPYSAYILFCGNVLEYNSPSNERNQQYVESLSTETCQFSFIAMQFFPFCACKTDHNSQAGSACHQPRLYPLPTGDVVVW